MQRTGILLARDPAAQRHAMQAGDAPAADAAAAPAGAKAAGAEAAGGGGGGAPAATDHAAPASYVYIKRAGGAAADDEVYAEVAILPGDDVADLAKRACAKFGWGMPSQASLFLVDHPPGGDEPSAEVEAEAMAPSRRLQSSWTLMRKSVTAGSWLLARVPAPPPPAAAGAGASCRAHGVISAPLLMAAPRTHLSPSPNARSPNSLFALFAHRRCWGGRRRSKCARAPHRAEARGDDARAQE